MKVTKIAFKGKFLFVRCYSRLTFARVFETAAPWNFAAPQLRLIADTEGLVDSRTATGGCCGGGDGCVACLGRSVGGGFGFSGMLLLVRCAFG
jgi:hypothetical protein